MKIKTLPKHARKMSCELAYIIGALQGDGYVHPNWFGIEVTDKTFAKYFFEQVKKWSGYKPSFTVAKRSHTMVIDGRKYRRKEMTYRVSLYGKEFAEFLLKNFRFGTKDWRVPKQILNASKTIKVAYLRGIFDAEGYPGLFGHACKISISSKNLHALKQIQELLQKLKFASHIFGPGKRGVFSLEIHKVSSISRFSKEIGSSISWKRKILQKIENYHKNNRKYSIQDYQTVIKLREKGLGKRKISKITSIPMSTIFYWIHRKRLPRVLRYDV